MEKQAFVIRLHCFAQWRKKSWAKRSWLYVSVTGNDFETKTSRWIMQCTILIFGLRFRTCATNPFLCPSSPLGSTFLFRTVKMSTHVVVVSNSSQNKKWFWIIPSFMNRTKASCWAFPLMSVLSSIWRAQSWAIFFDKTSTLLDIVRAESGIFF